MKYFKVIGDSIFLGVGTEHDMRMFQMKHRVILACSLEKAQYIQLGNVLYHDIWMLPETIQDDSVIDAQVIEISQNEYEALYSAIESGEEIQIEEDIPPQQDDEPIVDENTEITIEFIKEKKISEMSSTCSSVITNGFDVFLSDGESHHFSLTTQDQLNLITLTTMVASGETAIPYHADDELCKFYSPEDITAISTAATNFKTYHVSYFNSLKAYIESMNDIESISAITYGTEIPEEYMSDVLKVLLTQIGGSTNE